ncbi:MAG: DUF6912 family protein [Mycobacteriales bacterium]
MSATTSLLAELLQESALEDVPRTAFAVTIGLREFFAEGTEEELEYQALLAAARGSLRLLDADQHAARRRVVIVADLPDAALKEDPSVDRAVVAVASRVALRDVAAVYMDAPGAEDDVRRAAAFVLEADIGGADAQFVVDNAEGHELGWYATQEIGPLLELL